MMEPYDVADKLAQSLKTLTIERAALVASDASAEEIAEQDELAKDVKSALDLIVLHATERREQRDRHAKWKRILPECATAKEEYEAAALVTKKCSEDMLTAEDALTRAMRRLDDHILAEPEPTTYPSAKAIRAWKMGKRRLESDVEQRRGELMGLRQQQPDIGRAFQAAKQKFEQLAWRERQLRPPEPPPRLVPLDWRVERDSKLSPGTADAVGLR